MYRQQLCTTHWTTKEKETRKSEVSKKKNHQFFFCFGDRNKCNQTSCLKFYLNVCRTMNGLLCFRSFLFLWVFICAHIQTIRFCDLLSGKRARCVMLKIAVLLSLFRTFANVHHHLENREQNEFKEECHYSRFFFFLFFMCIWERIEI